MQEDAWMKSIPNKTVCDFYYVLFWIRVFAALVIVMLMVFTVMNQKKMQPVVFLTAIVTQAGLLTITLLDTLFNYLICDRALLGKEEEPKKKRDDVVNV